MSDTVPISDLWSQAYIKIETLHDKNPTEIHCGIDVWSNNYGTCPCELAIYFICCIKGINLLMFMVQVFNKTANVVAADEPPAHFSQLVKRNLSATFSKWIGREGTVT